MAARGYHPEPVPGMSATPQVGTYRLDGMLQGPMAAGEDHALRAWADSAKAAGLHFHLRVEGGTFSFVADPMVRKSSGRQGGDLESVMAAGLNTLLEMLPAQGNGCFSTLRSEEFLPGRAVQTLYPVGADGRIHPEQRTTDIDTAEAAPEITSASLRRAVLPALVALLLVLFVSTFFIDYRRLFSDARERLAPLQKEELVIRLDTGGIDYLAFELLKVDAKRNTLVFKLSRGSDWDFAMAASPADATAYGWKEYTTLHAIREGRLRIGLHDKEGKLLVTREIDIRGLMETESIEIAVVARTEERIAAVSLFP